jgi:hypothetical protein
MKILLVYIVIQKILLQKTDLEIKIKDDNVMQVGKTKTFLEH